MTSLPLLRATDDAEARGDAMGALEIIERHLDDGRADDFWRPARLTRLSQLSVFRSVLPRWATSRWILDQAAQCLDDRGRHRARRAMEIAVATRGGASTLVGHDRADALAKVIDHDWVYRQVLLYDLGALEGFLARTATPDLVAGADRIREWARTPLSAFRLVTETPRTLAWRELATGREVTAINIGSNSLVLPDECAIGRLVPIEEGGAMFETVPLYVPDDVALRVAEQPAEWLAAVADGCRPDRPPQDRMSTRGHHFRLLTDVPLVIQHRNVRAVLEAFGRLSEEEIDADPIAAQTAFVRVALENELEADEGWASPWPSVGAALMSPAVFHEVGEGLSRDDAPGLDRLAGLLASPADEVCRLFALSLRGAA